MAKGDHIYVSYGLYTHHGIDIGDGTVVHLTKNNSEIRRDKKRVFADGGKIHTRRYRKGERYARDEVVDRAISQIGPVDYDLIYNNCEHFASWCKTGIKRSKQVERGVATGTKVVIKGAGTVVAKQAAKQLCKSGCRTTARAVTRVASPVILIADVLQASTEIAGTFIGVDEETAKRVGQGTGAVASVVIGGLLGGPVGVAFCLGSWLIGEAIGETAAQAFTMAANTETAEQPNLATS